MLHRHLEPVGFLIILYTHRVSFDLRSVTCNLKIIVRVKGQFDVLTCNLCFNLILAVEILKIFQLCQREGHTVNVCSNFYLGNRQNPGDTVVRDRFLKCLYRFQFTIEASSFVHKWFFFFFRSAESGCIS